MMTMLLPACLFASVLVPRAGAEEVATVGASAPADPGSEGTPADPGTPVPAAGPAAAAEPAEATADSSAVAAHDPRFPPLPEGVVEVHWADVEVRRRASVRSTDFPPDARGLPVRCVVRVVIDEKGLPVEATPATDCPAAFAAGAREVAARYRFWPYRKDGKPRRVAFLIAANFGL